MVKGVVAVEDVGGESLAWSMPSFRVVADVRLMSLVNLCLGLHVKQPQTVQGVKAQGFKCIGLLAADIMGSAGFVHIQSHGPA